MEDNNMRETLQWTCEDTADWLTKNGFGLYANLLTEVHQIDGKALLLLTENDLRSPPLQMQVLGDVKRLWLKISQLQKRQNPLNLELNGYHRKYSLDQTDYGESVFVARQFAEEKIQHELASRISSVSETWRTFLSFLYAFLVFCLTSFVMTVVHDRVPDMKKYPPLPDIVLDSVPLIPWAFMMCELTGIVLVSMWIAVLVLHKHRMILLRRMFALSGTVFLLRCVTMFVTSLSVPGVHLECSGKMYGDTWTKLSRAFEIIFGMGMSVNGVRTCGDYMFSGHTVVITLLNFFITEYTPRRWYYLHTACWVLNLFGIFFILAAHEHYSIDVLIAFYISSRLFLYYHTLANSRTLKHEDKRTKAWFPLFSFFEEHVEGRVPNEYEWPLQWPNFLLIPKNNEEKSHGD
ncbi:sphingomyelin synthase-related protein 1 [Exaiptasia diaphana]|uniref:SAM domain-containing protein n=1 Tax=Exaiptasia diaphana TaxID=2652724 RepID=A0A913WTR3_EXADI|nr:sphingomyelin synthase-related protein 1 [Exaiptasia diaphana]KXJ17960.1 Sphingomyelin synthase-related protein 1 [Exaiptasia diaphana]